MLPRKDGVGQCFPYRGKWHGVPIEVMYESLYYKRIYKISLFDLFRQLRVTLVATFPDREGKTVGFPFREYALPLKRERWRA